MFVAIGQAVKQTWKRARASRRRWKEAWSLTYFIELRLHRKERRKEISKNPKTARQTFSITLQFECDL